MQTIRVILVQLGVAIIAATVHLPLARAAEEAVPADKTNVRQQLREEWQHLTPEQRAAKIQELRAKRGLPTPDAAEIQKRREFLKSLPPEDRERLREELRSLTPEERRAKLKELAAKRAHQSRFTEQERVARREVLRARLKKDLATLRQKKADGPLTEDEQTRLSRLEVLEQRFAHASDGANKGSEQKQTAPTAPGKVAP
jgi:hypothetical protein